MSKSTVMLWLHFFFESWMKWVCAEREGRETEGEGWNLIVDVLTESELWTVFIARSPLKIHFSSVGRLLRSLQIPWNHEGPCPHLLSWCIYPFSIRIQWSTWCPLQCQTVSACYLMPMEFILFHHSLSCKHYERLYTLNFNTQKDGFLWQV